MAFDGSGLFEQQWEYTFKGQLTQYMEACDEAFMWAARNTLELMVDRAKARLRAHVVAAGLAKAGAGQGKGSGRSLAGAIRFELYPKRGLARDPAGFIFVQPSAVKIYRAFEQGMTITAHGGKYLTVPVEGSPADRKNFGDKPRGHSILAALKAKGIQVGFVPARGARPAMLVAQSVRVRDMAGRSKISRAAPTKSGGFAKGAATVPLFWLVPNVKVPKRLSLTREFEAVAREFFAEYSQELDKMLRQVSVAPVRR